MGNHFHLLVRMHPGTDYTDDQIKKRYRDYTLCTEEMGLTDGQVPFFRAKWEDLSEYVKEIKQVFSRFYNKRHHRKGFFWSERFKSVIVDNGETLINCLAYIDLNPVRAAIVEKPGVGKVVMGRGAVNQKGPEAACLAALHAIRGAGRKPPVNLVLVAEGEEEIGSPHFPQVVRRPEVLAALKRTTGVFFSKVLRAGEKVHWFWPVSPGWRKWETSPLP